MSANEHLQPRQLAMFMPARQIAEGMHLNDTRTGEETSEEMLARKRADNAAPDAKANNRDFSGGVQQPLTVYHGNPQRPVMLRDGHHRLAHALETDPSMELPVEHIDPMNGRGMREFHDMGAAAVERRQRIAKLPKATPALTAPVDGIINALGLGQ